MLSPSVISQNDGMNGIESISFKDANGAIFFVCSNALCVRIGNSTKGVEVKCFSHGQKYAQPPPHGYAYGV